MGRSPTRRGTSRPRAEGARRCVRFATSTSTTRVSRWRGPELRATADASVAEYRLLQQRIGTSRAVVVQPAAYGIDNRGDAGRGRAAGARERARRRGAASRRDRRRAARRCMRGGVRGLRFTQHDPDTAVTTRRHDRAARAAHRTSSAGTRSCTCAATSSSTMSRLIERLPGTIVIDHMGRMPQPEGVRAPGLRAGPPAARKRPRMGEALPGPTSTPAPARPRYADVTTRRARTCAIAPASLRVGQRLAAPDRARRQARRCGAARPAAGMGARRGHAPPHPGRQPRRALRLLKLRSAAPL